MKIDDCQLFSVLVFSHFSVHANIYILTFGPGPNVSIFGPTGQNMGSTIGKVLSLSIIISK